MNVEIRQFEGPDRVGVLHVWESTGLTRPQNDPNKDIDRKLRHSAAGFLVAECDGEIVGTVMIGYDGHRGWINYLGVLPHLQGYGIGSMLMETAEELLMAMGCPKINLQVRASNAEAVAFYASLGYGNDDCLSLGKRLEID